MWYPTLFLFSLSCESCLMFIITAQLPLTTCLPVLPYSFCWSTVLPELLSKKNSPRVLCSHPPRCSPPHNTGQHASVASGPSTCLSPPVETTTMTLPVPLLKSTSPFRIPALPRASAKGLLCLLQADDLILVC